MSRNFFNKTRFFQALVCAAVIFLAAGCQGEGRQEDKTKQENTVSCTVTFNTNGGTPKNIQPVTVVKGESMGDLFPRVPVKYGYNFDGWFNNTENYTAGTIIEKDVDLTASWSLRTVTVSFSTDEGAPVIDPITVGRGKSIGEQYPKNPDKAGYDFVGWHDGEKIYTGATPVYDDITLSAKWNDAASIKNKFHVYLAFGQSNMVGYVGPPVGLFKTNDTNWVSQYGYDNPPENFVVMAAANNNRNAYNRQKGEWYPAIPPLNVYNNGLSPADFFGRTIANTVADKDIKIGVIVVAVDGCKSNLFFKDKDNFINYITAQPDWMRSQCAAYVDFLASGMIPNTGNYTTVDYPYKRLVDMAKIAQETGVIKGIIMAHDEGATDRASNEAIREIYNDLCEDLGLLQGEIPLLAGQSVGNSNGYIDSIPSAFNNDIPDTAFVIHSDGCTWWSDEDSDQQDHYSFGGYEEMGRRFAGKMLELLYK